jgi:hypothetical protein
VHNSHQEVWAAKLLPAQRDAVKAINYPIKYYDLVASLKKLFPNLDLITLWRFGDEMPTSKELSMIREVLGDIIKIEVEHGFRERAERSISSWSCDDPEPSIYSSQWN